MMNTLDACSERFFVRLMQKADDYGRHPADPLLLKSRLFPLLKQIRETDIARWTQECVRAGLIRSYDASNGRKYLEIPKFNQRKKWMKSEHPPPEGQVPLFKEADLSNKRDRVEMSRVDEKLFQEIPTEDEAVVAAKSLGVDEKFTRYVFQQWESQDGRNANGIIVRWTVYLSKRWKNERMQWENGTHKGNGSINGKINPRNVGVAGTDAEKTADTLAWLDRQKKARAIKRA